MYLCQNPCESGVLEQYFAVVERDNSTNTVLIIRKNKGGSRQTSSFDLRRAIGRIGRLHVPSNLYFVMQSTAHTSCASPTTQPFLLAGLWLFLPPPAFPPSPAHTNCPVRRCPCLSADIRRAKDRCLRSRPGHDQCVRIFHKHHHRRHASGGCRLSARQSACDAHVFGQGRGPVPGSVVSARSASRPAQVRHPCADRRAPRRGQGHAQCPARAGLRFPDHLQWRRVPGPDSSWCVLGASLRAWGVVCASERCGTCVLCATGSGFALSIRGHAPLRARQRLSK